MDAVDEQDGDLNELQGCEGRGCVVDEGRELSERSLRNTENPFFRSKQTFSSNEKF